jgi:carbon-monoxide dehydrogenase medium subunit
LRPYLDDYRWIRPKSLSEALEALGGGESIRPLAGGTDLMVYLYSGALAPCTFLDLQALEELGAPIGWNGGLRLSPLATYHQVRQDARLREEYPLLGRAAREVGGLAIQACGTWAGNIANASPAADGVPALMAYEAELELRSRRGARTVPLADFYQGYKQVEAKPDELITAIRLPPPAPERREYYRKVGTRRFQAISKTLLCGWIRLDADRRIPDLRLVLASVAPYTLRARQTERELRNKVLSRPLIDSACSALQDEIRPIDDIRSTERYRRTVTSNLLREFLNAQLGDER